MPNHYKGANTTPTPCLDSPTPPDLGSGTSAGRTLNDLGTNMVSASDPFESCCSSPCCCSSGMCGAGGSGGSDGGKPPGGGFPTMTTNQLYA
jgi:hypothetical protein